MMKRLLTFFALLLCLTSTSAWAVDCYQNNFGGASLVTTVLPSFAVPNNVPIGTKIWESGDLTVTVYCDNATHGYYDHASPWKEDIYAYILDDFHNTNPDVTNNPYLAFGVTYNGIDYDVPNVKIDTGACIDQKDDIKYEYNHAECNGVSPQKDVKFTVRFRLYVKLKSFPTEKITYSIPAVTVLTFDGSGGINTLANAKNLHYDIDGLSNIRFLDCGVTIQIYPESQVVNFGGIPAGNFDVSPATAPFSVSTIKDATAQCSEQFDVTTSFYTNDALYDDTHLDMGNGLLLRILDKTLNDDIIFNQYQPFGTYLPGDPSTVTHEYLAELIKNPTKEVETGPFSKSMVIKINYQ